MVEVVCPHCGITRTIVLNIGTNGSIENKRVRCPTKSKGCGKLFYTKNNRVIIVPQARTIPKEYTRAQMRALKIFLGLPEGGHKKGQSVFSDAQDIINQLKNFIEMRRK